MVKKIIIIFSIVFFCQLTIIAQDSVKNVLINQSDNTINAVESMPIFKGDLYSFLKEHIVYPIKAKQDKIEGRVIISFWVDINGKTYNHRIEKGIRDDINQEALRVSELIKFSKPAMSGGIPVKVRYYVTIEFKLPASKMHKVL
jgi:protein TonB